MQSFTLPSINLLLAAAFPGTHSHGPPVKLQRGVKKQANWAHVYWTRPGSTRAGRKCLVWSENSPPAAVRRPRSGEVWPTALLPPCSVKQGNGSFPPYFTASKYRAQAVNFKCPAYFKVAEPLRAADFCMFSVWMGFWHYVLATSCITALRIQTVNPINGFSHELVKTALMNSLVPRPSDVGVQ